MAKKNLLAANLKRPSLKREMKVSEDKMNEVVQQVSDTPPAKPAAAKSKADSPKPAPAKSNNKPAARQGRGAARKTTASPKSVNPAAGTKRLTLDIPQELHKKLKLLSIHQEISMKDYIIQVVERSLK